MARVLELRVHGVSNTPPASLLGIDPRPGDPDAEHGPRPRLVAGDLQTGYFRSSRAGRDDLPVVEAYSWGQLTSGARAVKDLRRAGWTLLIPFTLANMALHARPDVPADRDQEKLRSTAGMSAWLIRVFCLSLTAMLVLAFTGVGVDLFAWQCTDLTCLAALPGPTEFLAGGWWQAGGRALVIGLLAPLAALAVLALLSWRTFHYEAQTAAIPAAMTGARILTHPMQHPDFWRGEGQVRRLTLIHLATGAAVAALIPVTAMLYVHRPTGPQAWAGVTVVSLLGAAILLSVIALGRRHLTDRTEQRSAGALITTILTVTSLGVAGAIAYLLIPAGPNGRTAQTELCLRAGDTTCRRDLSMPSFDWTFAWLCAGQVLLLIAIAGINRSGRRALIPALLAVPLLLAGNLWSSGSLPALPASPEWLRTWQIAIAVASAAALATLLLPRSKSVRSHDETAEHGGIVWGGRAPAVLVGFGWLLGLGYSSGLMYWSTDMLNRGATPSGESPITLPVTVSWSGLAFLISLLFMSGLGLAAYLRYRRLRRQAQSVIAAEQSPMSSHQRRRAEDVASLRGLHELVGLDAVRVLGWFALGGLVIGVLGAAAALSHQPPVQPPVAGFEAVVKALADVGDSLAGLLPLAIAGLSLMVYRTDGVRRAVGVIWDIGTFWPRSAHPLAPPSYAECAVPQLQTRTAGLLALPEGHPDRIDALILSGHSQGAAICAAVIMQMSPQWRQRTWFFSHGCQLTRLYGRVFPAYFGPRPLRELTQALTPADQAKPQWTNFWRHTDPLGWQVAADQDEIVVRDPIALHPLGGEVSDPPILNHSGYPDSEEYQLRRNEVIVQLGG